jgi:hypothetical protein
MSYSFGRGRSRFRKRPHIWGAYSWHRNRDYGYGRRYISPAQRDRIRLEANRRRWKAMGSRVIADVASWTTTAYSAGTKSFRLVDCHGRAYGQRYTGTSEPVAREYRSYTVLVIDAKGEHQIMDCSTRVRIVARQQEDMHSKMSRMIKAAHRSAA